MTTETATKIKQLSELFVQFDDKGRKTAKAVFDELSSGKPAQLVAISKRSGLSSEETRSILNDWPGVFYDENDADTVIGFWGLTPNPVSQHKIVVDDVELYAWCAWDTLFIPIILGKECEVHSVSQETGEPVRLTVGPNGIVSAEPKSIHVSFVLPKSEDFGKNVINSFCHFVFFFSDKKSGERWAEGREDVFILTLEDAVKAAQQKIHYEFGKHFEFRKIG